MKDSYRGELFLCLKEVFGFCNDLVTTITPIMRKLLKLFLREKRNQLLDHCDQFGYAHLFPFTRNSSGTLYPVSGRELLSLPWKMFFPFVVLLTLDHHTDKPTDKYHAA